MTKMSRMTEIDIETMSIMSKQKITIKCQPAAVDMPDLIKTEHVNSSRLARQK